MEEFTDRERCGTGIRGVAMFIDSFVWFLLFFVAVYAIAALTGDIQTTAQGADANLTGRAGTAGFVIWLALGIGYHTVLEWQFGRTIGKALVRIEVRNEDGSSVTARASLIRNVSRLVDWLPALYLVGIASLTVSDQQQRLGDRMGGTAVVRP
jgi:uncharacterized RDD family membrane protein YckC